MRYGLLITLWASLTVMGCAAGDAPSTEDWSRHAQQTADQRLARRAQARPAVRPSARGEYLHGPRAQASAGADADHGLAFASDPSAAGFTARLVADDPAVNDTAPDGDELVPDADDAPATTQAAVQRGPLPGFWQTVKRDVKEAPKLLWSDTKASFGNAGNLIFLLGVGGASAALRPEVDDDIEDHYDRKRTFKSDWRDAFGAIGNPISHFGLALGLYAVGQWQQDAKTYEVGKRAISALAITGISTQLLKWAADTESPNGEEWAWPSGHTSMTIALATVLNDAYGPVAGIPAFALTGLVAVERMDSGEHHFSDIVFGAALGWVVAHTVMKEHRPEIFGGEVVPYADPVNNSAGIAWVKTLGN